MKLPPRCRFVIALALSLIAGTPSSIALGQSETSTTSPEALKVSKRHAEIAAAKKIPSRDFEQIVPYWTTEGGWHTELQLRNNLTSDPLKVTPLLRSADGTETPLNEVTILPGEVKTIDLHRALMEINSNLGDQSDAFGSIALRYTSRGMRNLFASVMVHDTGRPIMYHIDASNQASKFVTGSREGVWWLPSDSTRDYLILTNQAQSLLSGTLWLYGSSGKSWNKPLQLQPRQTQRLSVRQLLSEAGLDGSYGGIKIDVPNGAGSLDSVHILYDETAGFSATMKMFDSNPKVELQTRDFAGTGVWTTRAPMLALSLPDPVLGLPSGTILRPTIFLRNTTGKPARVKTTFHWRGASGSGQSQAPDLTLTPYETHRMDVFDMQAKGILPQDAYWAQTTLVTDGNPDAIMAIAASYDSTLRYGAQTPFSDQLSSQLEGGQWKVDSTHTSLIAVGNGSSQPVNAELTIFYNRGQKTYRLDKTIAGEDQWYVDLGQLIREQVPDKDGNTIPATTALGAYRLQQIDNLGQDYLYEGKVITDKTYGHATYGCMTCCGYTDSDYGVPFLVEDPTSVGVGDTEEVDVYGPNACTGSLDLLDSYFGTWSSNNTSVLTASLESVTGVAVGSARISARAALLPSGGGEDQRSCPHAPVITSGNGNVATLSCTAVTRGQTTTCTASGPSGATFSNWQFTDSNSNTVSSTNTQAQWSGVAVQSGTVSVTVGTSDGGQQVLTAPLTAINRTNFAFTAVNPSQISGNSITCYNGDTTTLTSPPTNNQDEGASCVDLAFSYQTSAAISDGGPNNGYQYVTSVSASNNGQATQYQYIIVSDLLSATTFYNAQCGTFSNSNTSGFIAGSQLKQNVLDHEQGPVLSHWTVYVNAQNASSNNIGTVLEGVIGGPGLSQSTFIQNVNTAGTSALNNIENIEHAPSNEPCNGLATYDSSQACKYCGVINVGPSYAPCNGAQPVAYCQ